MCKSISLSSKGLCEAAVLDKEKFTFVFGGHDFVCSRIQASFISGKVRRALWSDVTADRLIVDIRGDVSLFDVVVKLMNGECIEVNGQNAQFMRDVSVFLDNNELTKLVTSVIENEEELCLENVIDRLRMKQVIELNIDNEVDFVASHFYELEEQQISVLSVDDLDSIFRSSSLQVKDEDSVLNVVLSHVDSVTNNYPLLRHICPEYLSEDRLSEYFLMASSGVIGDVWPVICDCVRRFGSSLVQTYIFNSVPHFRNGSATFQVCEDDPFKGIISHLSTKCGGNVHERGIVEITASSTYGDNQPHMVTDYGWNDYWWSYSLENSWIMFEFKTVSVSPTGYSLKSGGSGGEHLLKWVIEGSNDNKLWMVLDERDTSELNGEYITRSYSLSSPNDAFFRSLRLRQTGKSSYESDTLMLSEIEFFGLAREDSDLYSTGTRR